MRGPHAETVEQAVEQLKEAQTFFLYAKKGMGLYSPKDAWENFKLHCHQLSQWIEHCVTEEEKPELVKTLFAAEKILLDNKQHSR